MQYLALLTGDETRAPQPGGPGWDALMEGYERFGAEGGKAIVTGEALELSDQATTVRPGTEGPLVTAGPFAETTEVVGGIYVLDVATLDDAIELARLIPAAETGAVELRPLVQWFEQDPAERDRSLRRHLALIVEPETAVPDTPEWDDMAAEHGRFGEAAGAAVVGGGALHPAATATTVRVRNGEVLVTDGPYAEAAEVVGGFYLLATPDREAAVALAGRIPVAPGGGIELWPIMELDG